MSYTFQIISISILIPSPSHSLTQPCAVRSVTPTPKTENSVLELDLWFIISLLGRSSRYRGGFAGMLTPLRRPTH